MFVVLYVVTALKPEAQAFVDKYRLKKTKLDGFTLFVNESVRLIISGIGVENGYKATEYILDRFAILESDIFLNVGICGASKKHELGKLIQIGSISYAENYVVLNGSVKNNLRCLDEEANNDTYEIVDMESYGFYKALSKHPKIQNIYIFKVVSDHFEPALVTKEKTKELIFKNIEAVDRIIQR